MSIWSNIKDAFFDSFYKWQRDAFLERLAGLLVFLVLVFMAFIGLLIFVALVIAGCVKIYTTIIAAPVLSGFVISIIVGLILIAYFGGSNERS